MQRETVSQNRVESHRRRHLVLACDFPHMYSTHLGGLIHMNMNIPQRDGEGRKRENEHTGDWQELPER